MVHLFQLLAGEWVHIGSVPKKALFLAMRWEKENPAFRAVIAW